MSHSEAAPAPPNALTACPPSAAFWSPHTVMLVLGGAAVLLPYLLLPVIPGTDYPNHLARLAALGAAPGSAIRGSYVPHWALMPDLGLDLVYMLLKPVASADTVMRLCLVGGMAAMLAGAAAIQRTLFGRFTFSPAIMPLCAAGLPVVMGYVNFVMSCGLVLPGIWLWLDSRGRLTAARVAAIAAIGAAAWICHVAGYAMLMVFIAASRLWECRRARRLPDVLLAALPVLAIALPGLAMSALAEKETVAASHVSYGAIDLRSLLAPAMTTGTSADFILAGGLLALFCLCLVSGRWRVAQPARAGLVVLGLAVATLPWQVGAATDVGSRLVSPVLLLTLAASSVTPPSGRAGKALAMALIVLLIAGRDGMVIAQGRAEARVVAAFRSADKALTPGATLMVATDEWRAADCTRATSAFSSIGPNTHLAAYATIDRGVWEPFIFAAKGKQPIRSVNGDEPGELPSIAPPALDALAERARSGGAPGAGLPPGWPAHFAYLLVVGRGCAANPMPGLLKSLAAGPGFTLFSIVPAAKG